jgi:hypothetical protein
MTTGPDVMAAVVVKTLKVSGGGNGNGHVTAPPAAGTAALVALSWRPRGIRSIAPRRTRGTLSWC